jgi:RNA polymerase sigma-70 factor, ECF subfamily
MERSTTDQNVGNTARLQCTDVRPCHVSGKISEAAKQNANMARRNAYDLFVLLDRQTSGILLDCLKQLSPAHREVIDLVYYHQKSIDEVAGITGIPPNTVKTRMFYARKRIAELMAAQGIDRAIV